MHRCRFPQSFFASKHNQRWWERESKQESDNRTDFKNLELKVILIRSFHKEEEEEEAEERKKERSQRRR